MTTTSIHNEIPSTVADTSYPSDDLLTVCDPSVRDYDGIFQLLRGRSWCEMPAVEFIRGDTPIPDLTPEAFHYGDPVRCTDFAVAITITLGAANGDAEVAICAVKK